VLPGLLGDADALSMSGMGFYDAFVAALNETYPGSSQVDV
jgi:hypothetical protein